MFEGFFSDLLFNSWYCANIDLCRWSKKENVDRRRNLTKQEFVDQYESKGIPVVIEGIVDKWPAYRNFNREYLENKYGHLAFKTDKQISVKLSNYLKYCGVIPSDDGLDVTVPATMVQWFNDFYHIKHPIKDPIEFVQRPGDLVFIPSGWWHSVINLDSTIAFTQNYVSESNLRKVFIFLKTKQDLGLSKKFSDVLTQHHPDLYQQLLDDTNQKDWSEIIGDDGEDWILDL
eukprot:TRINITY_DN659_c1_g1_i7.p1 TRINITY_DN659_c1_g1~~TRINITY_DN659_c1_g1_i7.p1  ORF type:complete len:231 (-),score=47.68 TRINITY_DN659_c1_g1_i7:123-815(-)